MTKKNDTWQPEWVKLPILEFARTIHSLGDDSEAIAKWVKKFSEDLLFNNVQSDNDFTNFLLQEASEKYSTRHQVCIVAGRASVKSRKKKSETRQDVAESASRTSEADTAPAEEAGESQGRTADESLRGIAKVAPSAVRFLPTLQELYDFATDERLDHDDARDWYEMTVNGRDGHDRNGNIITNWKGACKRFCDSRKNKRESA